VTLIDLAKYPATWSVARPLCDSWAYCDSITACGGRTDGRIYCLQLCCALAQLSVTKVV